MKHAIHFRRISRGATLVEALIAVGVLAVAVPLVFGALAEAGKTGSSAQVETRSSWIVPACMAEIEASRHGRPQYFAATTAGQPFPPAGDVWALAFAQDGRPVGKLSKALYERGVKELDGKPVRFVALLSASVDSAIQQPAPMLRVRISIEHPVSAPAVRRSKLDFHTRIP